MKKVLLFLFEGYCEFEIATAISILRNTHQLNTFGLEKSIYRSEAGLATIPDFTINEVNSDDYDALIIPGGDLQPIAEAGELFHTVKSFADKGKILAAICSGVYVLAKAQVLTDSPYTVTLTKGQRDFLGCFDEAGYQYKPVVLNRNILTAQGHAFVEFGIELADLLGVMDGAKKEFYQGHRNRFMEID